MIAANFKERGIFATYQLGIIIDFNATEKYFYTRNVHRAYIVMHRSQYILHHMYILVYA